MKILWVLTPSPTHQVLLSFETWPSLRLRRKKMAGFKLSNVFSIAGSDPNMKIDLLYLFIKRGKLSFYKNNKLVNEFRDSEHYY